MLVKMLVVCKEVINHIRCRTNKTVKMKVSDTKLCATAVGIADKWKNKALQNLQASIQCGKVDPAKGHALMQYVQSITGNPHNVQHGDHT